MQVKHEGERRNIFLRYLGEVATAVSGINQADRESLYEQLLKVAKRKTAAADTKFDERGKAVEEEEAEDFGDNVLIVDPATHHVLQCKLATSGCRQNKRRGRRRAGWQEAGRENRPAEDETGRRQ